MVFRTAETEERNWGTEVHIVNEQEKGFCGKILKLKKGFKSSIHRHDKNESLFLMSGKVFFEIGENPENMDGNIVEPGTVVDVFNGIWHRYFGIEDSVLVEVSSPAEGREWYNGIGGGEIVDFESWKEGILF